MIQTIRKNAKVLAITLITIVIIIVAAICINKLMIKKLYKKEYSEYVTQYAQEYNIKEELIYAMIKAESKFNADAKSHQKAQGLMQLLYSTAQDMAKKVEIELTEENILEPQININLGTKYISTLIEKYGVIEIALAAYNAGTGTVDTWIEKGVIKPDGSDIENIPFKETNTYVRKIMRDYKIYMQLDESKY